MFTRKQRAQSAMEYLMTYGWAILIIAVVLGVLFSLGVFSGSSLLGTSCVAYAGYYCATPVMGYGTGYLGSTTATLSVSVGQNTGSSWGSSTAPVQLFCGNQTSTLAANGLGFYPFPTTAAIANVLGSTANPFSATIYSGAIDTGVQMECAGAGALGASPPVGSAFTGYVWAVYNTGTSYATGANIIVKLAAVSVKVS